ncbi:hypothetical protein BC826DRAFT_103275 [Russula brevipes]|nr:hypothetical protein BC826DRAFT_103275 [Russula brevipes]
MRRALWRGLEGGMEGCWWWWSSALSAWWTMGAKLGERRDWLLLRGYERARNFFFFFSFFFPYFGAIESSRFAGIAETYRSHVQNVQGHFLDKVGPCLPAFPYDTIIGESTKFRGSGLPFWISVNAYSRIFSCIHVRPGVTSARNPGGQSDTTVQAFKYFQAPNRTRWERVLIANCNPMHDLMRDHKGLNRRASWIWNR